MIYDRELILCTLPAGVGTLLQGKLIEVSHHLYAEQEVFHRRYWEAVQAGTRIDKMAAMPRMLGDDIAAEMYVQLDDGHVYRIEQAQEATDEDGLDIYLLSLYRMGGNYDIGRPDAAP